MKSIASKTEDHRVRVGAQRREKTRLRLLENALVVFNEKGPDLAVTEDFIAAAGVARGTFYNHFRTTGDLLLALAGSMSDEVLHVVDPIVLQYDNPVERFCVGTRLYMQMALRYPLWGAFLRRVGTQLATRGQLIETYLTRDLTLAHKKKMLSVRDVPVAHDIVLGSIFYGIDSMLRQPSLVKHSENIMRHVLIGLGLSADEAQRIAFMPLPVPGPVEGPIFSKLKQSKPKAVRPRVKAPLVSLVK
jgi:AcrR family transcriptional regulator